MVDFGGVSIKELPQGIKDALLDPNALRDPANALNPLVSLLEAGAGALKHARFLFSSPGEWISTGPVGFVPRMIFVYYGGNFINSYGMALDVASQACSGFDTTFGIDVLYNYFFRDRIGHVSRPGWTVGDLYLTAFGPGGIDFHNVVSGSSIIVVHVLG